MSTKIYDAFLLAPDVDVFELQRVLSSEFVPMVRRHEYQGLLDTVIEAWDRAFHRDAAATFTEQLFEELNAKPVFEDRAGIQASTTLVRNVKRRETYMLVFGGLTRLSEQLLALPQVVGEFEYWNNTDRPDHLTDAQWADRALAWDEALGTDATPSAAGLTMELVPTWRRGLTSTGLKAELPNLVLPTSDLRTRQLGRSFYLDEVGKQTPAEERIQAIFHAMYAWGANEIDAEVKARYIDQARPTIEALGVDLRDLAAAIPDRRW